MEVQLIGPMTGLPDYNRPAFAEAAAYLRRLGYSVWSPAEESSPGVGAYSYYMRRSLSHLLEVDAAVILPGWQASPGARLEVAAALMLDTIILPLGMAHLLESHE